VFRQEGRYEFDRVRRVGSDAHPAPAAVGISAQGPPTRWCSAGWCNPPGPAPLPSRPWPSPSPGAWPMRCWAADV